MQPNQRQVTHAGLRVRITLALAARVADGAACVQLRCGQWLVLRACRGQPPLLHWLKCVEFPGVAAPVISATS